jgi:hypothetical protein
MANNTTPPQYFSRKNEQKGVLIDVDAPSRAPHPASPSFSIEPSQATATTAEHRTLFIGAMANRLKRLIAFSVVERNCRARFGQGMEGVRLYFQLLDYVQRSNVSEAVDEFRKRFAPMVDQEFLNKSGAQPK